MTDALKNFKCDFEIFGKVQGVFFRKHTETQAKKLGLRGWCMNTDAGTVKGYIEGPQDNIKKMQNWLKNVGSPRSRIMNATFTDMKEISRPEFDNFVIRR